MTQPPSSPPPGPPGPPGPSGPPPAGPPPFGTPAPGPSGQPSGQQAGPPPGFVVLTVQGSAMTSNMIAPKVTLNGYPVPTSYGENTLPVPPGRWHVAVQAQWMRAYGQAAMDVEVTSGQAVRVFYAAPWHQFTTGRIGYEKQRRKGGLVLLLVLAVVVLLVGGFAILGSM